MVSLDSYTETQRDLEEAARVLAAEMLPGERLSDAARRIVAASRRPRLIADPAARAKGKASKIVPEGSGSHRLNLEQLVAATPWLTMGTLRRWLLHRHTNGLDRCVTELDGLLLVDEVAFNRWVDKRPGRKHRRVLGENLAKRRRSRLRKVEHD